MMRTVNGQAIRTGMTTIVVAFAAVGMVLCAGRLRAGLGAGRAPDRGRSTGSETRKTGVGARGLRQTHGRHRQEAGTEEKAERLARLRGIALDRETLHRFLERYAGHDRGRLISDGYLLASAPQRGTAMISGEFRTPEGEALLVHANEMLFGLLFGDEATGVSFDRVERELLTLTLPRRKAAALDFMKAATEIGAVGTWRDPEGVSDDSRTDNVVLEVEYGEEPGEAIGDGIVRALALINNLEINEQVLYARMIGVEQSTLIE